MTEIDLKNYLAQYRENKEGTRIYIDALMRYRETLESFSVDVTKEYIKDIDRRINQLEDEIKQKDAIVFEWSKLIRNDTARELFVKHYINGVDWLTIEDIYHYATSTVYGYNKRALTEITQKAVQDIAPASVQTATSIL